MVHLRPAASAVLLWAQGLPGEVRAKQQPLSACSEPQMPSALLAQVLYQWCLPWQSFFCFLSPFISKELCHFCCLTVLQSPQALSVCSC